MTNIPQKNIYKLVMRVHTLKPILLFLHRKIIHTLSYELERNTTYGYSTFNHFLDTIIHM